ncbi:IS66 family transposase [Peloplasma aerotolerans]|uniref:Transposase n=1 Tax=Peloplasma aerotolerans TaxID=3044389 RepID=A0AAW6UCG2_9MOLU|nr:transposase [Mariniplasma sp. M4Ah]MDI6453649.1 transposase [Mariniplasma sp. M4Ah]
MKRRNNHEKNIIQTETSFKGYTKLNKNNPKIKLQRCFTHARRRFYHIDKTLPEENYFWSSVKKILDIIGKLFNLESIYKKENLIAPDLLKPRSQEHPIIPKELEALLFNPIYILGLALGGAVSYAKKVKLKLSTFLSSGYIEI